MSRRHSAEKREIIPDPKFQDIVVAKFMNSVMRAGKKSVALAVTLQPTEKTLTEAEIEAVGSKIVAEIGKRYGATLRG